MKYIKRIMVNVILQTESIWRNNNDVNTFRLINSSLSIKWIVKLFIYIFDSQYKRT